MVTDRSQEPREQQAEKEGESQRLLKVPKPGVDTEGRWIKKAGKLLYGYKRHAVTDTEGMVLHVVTTAANVHEIANLEEVLREAGLPKNTPFFADKGYASQANRDLLKEKRLRDRIQKKATRGRALTGQER
ncbi:transposase [Pontibacter sp. E15-1]|uniref:transposase n=1 Tax=Pontibacter sp. E15-1 TaxID=2919918 RepID=UPI0039785508